MNIVAIENEEQRDALMREALADNHAPLYPTHRVLLPDGRLAGSVSLFSIPLFTVWVKTDLSPRQSLEFITGVTEFARKSTDKKVVTLCPPQSPVHPHMARFGYRTHIPVTSLFIQEK